MIKASIETAIIKDLERAKAFKAEGQHGKARVLARRATGRACQMLLGKHNALRPGMSALDSIMELRRSNFAKPDWKPLLSHFLLHVDADHNLPVGIDLVEEAATLISEMTKIKTPRSECNGKH